MTRTDSALSHLECARCAARLEAGRPANLCACGGILLARYDLERARRGLPRPGSGGRRGLWRYAAVLPVGGTRHIVDLGEGGTPLARLSSLGREAGIEDLWIKDESTNPTGSFKARGMAVAVARMKELGLTRGIVPTAGNAGLAFAAYAAAAGIAARVVMPRDAPPAFIAACRLLGAEVVEVDGTIADAGKSAAAMIAAEGFFDVSTLKEPYRLEGKKTMAYELWEEMDRLPDVIVYPTGGGTGLIGMQKAFDELQAMGPWSGRWAFGKGPRLISVQAEGCAPVVQAFEGGKLETKSWPGAKTLAAGLRVPSPYGGALILQVIAASGGAAVAVSDEALLAATGRLARQSGRLVSPEAGATLAALEILHERQLIDSDERVLLLLTGGGMMYLPQGAGGLPG